MENCDVGDVGYDGDVVYGGFSSPPPCPGEGGVELPLLPVAVWETEMLRVLGMVL
jgi:hypothetical protein